MSTISLTIKRKYIVPDGRVQYKCVGNLFDYLVNLKEDFFEYHIQRRIVKNTYLDEIYSTVKRKEPLPTITLSCVSEINNEEGEEIQLDLDNCEILDGLQRTFRLKSIITIKQIIDEHSFKDYRQLRTFFKDGDPDGYGALEFVNTKFLKALFEDGGADAIIDSYKNNEIELTIWTGLNEKETIRQMMLLNAGQRPVSATHQYELVFLHYFIKGDISVEGVSLLREKDKSYFDVKRGKRESGQFLLASIIVALQSFIQKKPLRVTPANKLLIEASDYIPQNLIDYYFDKSFLEYFIEKIYELDLASDDPKWRLWIGKDTTLSGIFAAIGYYAATIEDEKKCITNFVERVVSNEINFELSDFEKEYDSLSSANVNVGNALRKSIYCYTLAQLEGNKSYSWKDCFPKKRQEDENW